MDNRREDGEDKLTKDRQNVLNQTEEKKRWETKKQPAINKNKNGEKDLQGKPKEEQNKEKLPCRSNQWLKASPRWLGVLLGNGRIAGIKGCEKLVEQHRDRLTAKAEEAERW